MIFCLMGVPSAHESTWGMPFVARMTTNTETEFCCQEGNATKAVQPLKEKDVVQGILPYIQVWYLQTAPQKSIFLSPFPVIVGEHSKVSRSQIQYRQCELQEHKRLCLFNKDDFRGWGGEGRWHLKAVVLYESICRVTKATGSHSFQAPSSTRQACLRGTAMG